MVRIARVVVPGFPHHITQRGNRRQKTFFRDEDYEVYIDLVAGHCRKRGVEIWAYCLMPNHVHLVAVPETEESLRQAIAEAHRRYTRMINFREGWRGYLWQGRFSSFPMDDEYLFRAARYIEMNPVRAGLVDMAEDYRWSSAKAHLTGLDDKLVKAAPLLDKSIDWREYLREAESEEFAGRLRRHQHTGRPFGGPGLLEKIQHLLGRDLKPKKRGRKPKKGKK
jgi:putative transposase